MPVRDMKMLQYNKEQSLQYMKISPNEMGHNNTTSKRNDIVLMTYIVKESISWHCGHVSKTN